MHFELQNHEIPGIATFEEGPGGLTVLDIVTPVAEARVFLLGAQLCHWRPKGMQPVLFMSDQSAFEEGKPIRGGVPVCFPWFGPREGLPAHGFARLRSWRVAELRLLETGAVRAVFIDSSDASTRALWPHDYEIRLAFTIGLRLTMELEVENTSRETFNFGEALHSYFLVGDARQAAVRGLEGAFYRDFRDRSKLTRQEGSIGFVEETDRLYVNTAASCVLEDPVMARRIVVAKSGSESTVVWNPWVAKSVAMPDFGDEEWPRMVCVETANAAENMRSLAPGAKHSMRADVSVEPLG